MNATKHARIRPFPHDNSIQAIVSRVNELNANLHALRADLSLPCYAVPSQNRVNLRKWKTHTEWSIDSRAKVKHEYPDMLPSPEVMKGAIEEYRGGMSAIM